MKRIRIVVEDPRLKTAVAYYWMRFLSNEYAVLFTAVFLLRGFEGFAYAKNPTRFIRSKTDAVLFGVQGLSLCSSAGIVGYRLVIAEPWPSTTFWPGIALFLFACLGRCVAFSILGHEYRSYLEMVVKERLVISGMFALIRYPLSMFYLMEMCSLVLIKWNSISLAAVILAIVVTLYRIRREEHRLSGLFGEHFAAYRHVTKRLVPFVY